MCLPSFRWSVVAPYGWEKALSSAMNWTVSQIYFVHTKKINFSLSPVVAQTSFSSFIGNRTFETQELECWPGAQPYVSPYGWALLSEQWAKALSSMARNLTLLYAFTKWNPISASCTRLCKLKWNWKTGACNVMPKPNPFFKQQNWQRLAAIGTTLTFHVGI